MEVLLPMLEELIQLKNDKIAKLGDTILFTCIKYKIIYNYIYLNWLYLIYLSSFDDLSEQAV